MQTSIAVGISLPKKIVTKIDHDRGDIPRSRYVLRILEETYQDIRTKHRMIEKRGNQDLLDDHGVKTVVVKQTPST
jgi:hypothetical protein